ncbi:hypothetical protein LPJ61_002470 [Coemansia biformis]|uniref:Uncharacterized protein n=1 Tax=Coemansia biformis TaxID=1286918 RepID=A0A9W8CX68_9FUNG|nr:hypothetical protein LPJ61_002470 [Coemansia biformis]
MYARNFVSPTSPRGQHHFRPAENGLAIDTRNVGHYHDEAGPDSREIYNSATPLSRRNSQQQPQQWQGAAAMHRSTSAVSRPQAVHGSPDRLAGAVPLGPYTRAAGVQGGQAELAPVVAWGHIIAGSGGQVAGVHTPQTRHFERETRPHRVEGAASPLNSAVRQDVFTTPPTAHRASISTVLSAGPRQLDAAHVTPRMRVRNNTTGTPSYVSHSQSEFDTYNGRSVATAFGLESQFSRPNFDDSSMYAHTPGRDPYQAAMHATGRNRGSMGASAGPRGGAGHQENFLTPDSPNVAAFGARPRGHSRVSSMVSPASRARAIEDTHNALNGGARAGRGAPAAQTPDERRGQRMRAAHSWLPSATGGGARDTQSDTFAWGLPGATRSRAGSFAVSGAGRQLTQDQQMQIQRGNGLSVEPGRHPHRTSYTGSGQRSHTPPPIGSSQQRGAHHVPPARSGEAGSSFVSASARKSRHQSQQQKSNKTPIRSNWFHKAEALNDSDLKDQEFLSSDEEDFGDEVRGYAGDMVAQQKLIQKQQRSIFDLNMQCKMLQTAMDSSTKEPYEALLSDFGRTCASNRRANRELEQLRSEREVLREQCAQLEDTLANPPPCMAPHGLSEEEQEQVARLEEALEDAQRDLEAEAALAKQRIHHLEDKDMQIRQLQEELTRERLNSEHWRQQAMDLRAVAASAQPLQKRASGTLPSADSYGPTSARRRTGTTTTASETATVRAASEDSGSSGGDERVAGPNGKPMPRDGLESALQQSEQKRRQLEETARRAEKKMRDYEEQRRVLQLEMKRMQENRLALHTTSDQAEIVRLADENETLKDNLDALQQQLVDARADAQAHAEAALTAISSLKLDSDEEVEGSAAQRAEIARLKLECRDFEQQTKVHEASVRNLTEELEHSRSQMQRLCHDYLRPRLRELTVGAAQAESVYDHVRRWSQLKVVVPPEDETAPTKSSARHPVRVAPLAPAPATTGFGLGRPAGASR